MTQTELEALSSAVKDAVRLLELARQAIGIQIPLPVMKRLEREMNTVGAWERVRAWYDVQPYYRYSVAGELLQAQLLSEAIEKLNAFLREVEPRREPDLTLPKTRRSQ